MELNNVRDRIAARDVFLRFTSRDLKYRILQNKILILYPINMVMLLVVMVMPFVLVDLLKPIVLEFLEESTAAYGWALLILWFIFSISGTIIYFKSRLFRTHNKAERRIKVYESALSYKKTSFWI